VSAQREGFQAGADLSGGDVPCCQQRHSIAENDINDVSYQGFRLSGLYEFNADWDLLSSIRSSRSIAEGVFSADPELDDYDIVRFTPDDSSRTSSTIPPGR
jgi:iron complex outermembrane receptor protein